MIQDSYPSDQNNLSPTHNFQFNKKPSSQANPVGQVSPTVVSPNPSSPPYAGARINLNVGKKFSDPYNERPNEPLSPMSFELPSPEQQESFK